MFARPSLIPWINDTRKSLYKIQLLENKRLKEISNEEKKIQSYLKKLLRSNTPNSLSYFEKIVEQLLAAKPGIQLPLMNNPDKKDDEVVISIPLTWSPRTEGFFGPKGSELFQVLQNLPRFLTPKQQHGLEEVDRLVVEAQKIIKENENVAEEKNPWLGLKKLREIYTQITDLEFDNNLYILSTDARSPLSIINDWISYEYTRLFKNISKVDYDPYGYNIRGALNIILSVAIEDREYTKDWHKINEALNSEEDLFIIKSIFDDYIYQQTVFNLNKLGQDIEVIDNENTETVLQNILTKLKDTPVIKRSLQKTTLASFSIEEFTELLHSRQLIMGKEGLFAPMPIFADFYLSRKSDNQEAQEVEKKEDSIKKMPIPKNDIVLPSLIERLQMAFDSTFDVYDKKQNERSFANYFLGWPENKMPGSRWGTAFLMLDSLFYVLGGAVLIPAKNSLKFIIEFLLKSLEVSLNHASNWSKKNDHPILSGAFSLASYIPRALWAVGRAVTSPINSLKAAVATGDNFGKKHGRVAGFFATASLSILSIALSVAVFVAVAVFAPIALTALVDEVGMSVAMYAGLGAGAAVASKEVIKDCVEQPKQSVSPSPSSPSSYSRSYKSLLPTAALKSDDHKQYPEDKSHFGSVVSAKNRVKNEVCVFEVNYRATI